MSIQTLEVSKMTQTSQNISLSQVHPIEVGFATCNWQGETLQPGATRCKDGIEWVCGTNGEMRKSGNKC
jgi:hypothetical protein